MKSVRQIVQQSNRIQSALYLRECKAKAGAPPSYYKVDIEQRTIREIANKLINKVTNGNKHQHRAF